jgi:hypothetical protein
MRSTSPSCCGRTARQSRRPSSIAAPHEGPRGSADPSAALAFVVRILADRILSDRFPADRFLADRFLSNHFPADRIGVLPILDARAPVYLGPRLPGPPSTWAPVCLVCGVLAVLFLRARLVCLRLHLRHNSCSFRMSRHNRHVSTPARVPRRSYAVVVATRAQLRSHAGGSPRWCSATRLKSIRDAQLLQKLARERKVGRRDADRGVLQELCSRAAGQQGSRAVGQ